ncbi:MAG: fibronectin type III domain-containing protein [Verrucomicrobia bacterium]|nr:fibronectin type III domain-containing protein [Verrucomicrobiota bacterium]
MASNPTPENNDIALALAVQMADGLTKHGVTAKVKVITAAEMLAKIAHVRANEKAYSKCKAATAVAEAQVQEQDRLSSAFITAAAGVLRISLGTRWSAAWEPTGFPGNSTKVPRSQGKRFILLSSLAEYFTDNPNKEAPNQNITAATAGARYAAFAQARKNAADKLEEQKTCKAPRDEAFDDLKLTIRLVIDDLGYRLPADDPRWGAFGLSSPNDPDTPESASEVELTVAGSNTVIVTFKHGKRADRHRIFARLLPEETEFTQHALVHDLSYTFTDLPSGKTLEVKITAANETGEAAPTEAVSVVVG